MRTSAQPRGGCRYLEKQTAPCRQTVEWHNQAMAEEGDLKVNMSERWRGKLNKRSGALCFSVELWTHQMRREGRGGVLFISLGRLRGLLYSVIRLKCNGDLLITDRRLGSVFSLSTLA